MTIQSNFAELGADGDAPRAAPIVSETYWGYVVRPSEPLLERAALIEMIATFSGVLAFMAAFGIWLLPGADDSAQVWPFKLAGTAVFVLFATWLIWTARTGRVRELHLDRAKREIRIVARNRKGQGRLLSVHPFASVASIVLRHHASGMFPARLCLRLADSGQVLNVARSGADELLPIRDRLVADLSPRFASRA